jgi:hypothetical protein
MEINQKIQDYEQVVEKIIFDEEELKELKITIRNYAEGKIQAKQLKQQLLQCRARMVKDVSNFLCFCMDRVRDNNSNSANKKSDIYQLEISNEQLQQEILEKNELLEKVAKKINILVSNTMKLDIEK